MNCTCISNGCCKKSSVMTYLARTGVGASMRGIRVRVFCQINHAATIRAIPAATPQRIRICFLVMGVLPAEASPGGTFALDVVNVIRCILEASTRAGGQTFLSASGHSCPDKPGGGLLKL